MGSLRRLLGQGILRSGGESFDWYVDSVNGNDGNTGQAPGDAFQTIAALEAAAINDGDSIGLARGSHWREQLDLTNNDILLGAYADGDAPVLDASDIAANASFIKTGGRVNVYQITVNPVLSVTTFVNVWENSNFLTEVVDVATCDATPGSYTVTSHAVAPITIYVHAGDSSSVITNGKTYENGMRGYGLLSIGDNVSVTGITTRNNLEGNGSMEVWLGATVTDCRFENGTKHNFYIKQGTVTGCVAHNAYYAGGGSTMFVFNQNAPSGDNVTFVNCTAEMPTYDATIDGFFGHRNVSGAFGTITFNGCIAINCYTGFWALHVTALRFIDCCVDDCLYPYATNGSLDSTFVNCGAYSTAIKPTRVFSGIPANATISITGGSYYFGVGCNQFVFSDQAGVDLTVSEITLVSENDNQTTIFYFNNNASLYTVNDNQLTADCSGGGSNYLAINIDIADLIADRNCFNVWVRGFIAGGGPFLSLATWKVASGEDTNSTEGGCTNISNPCI